MGSWSRSEVIGCLSLVLGVLGLAAVIVVPEVRDFLGLKKESDSSQSNPSPSAPDPQPVHEPSPPAPIPSKDVELHPTATPAESTTASSRPKAPTRPPTPELPIEFSLRDGEQRSLLRDQASLGIAFNSIGEEEFATLRVNTPDSGSVPHAVLNGGTRLEFTVKGKVYYVYVLEINQVEKTAKLRVAQKSDG